MLDAHVALFAVLLVLVSVPAGLSSIAALRQNRWTGRDVVLAMSASGLVFCCIAGLYGALYRNSFVQEASVAIGALVLFTGFLTSLFS